MSNVTMAKDVETVLSYFKLSFHFPGRVEQEHHKHHFVYFLCGPSIKLGTSGIRIIIVLDSDVYRLHYFNLMNVY